MKVLIDPPSGWMYGFPKEVEEDSDWEEVLKEAGYPKKDIEFALSYMRVIRNES